MSEVKDLGITIDNKLNFNKHIDTIIKKAKKFLGCITRIGKDFEQVATLVHLYNTLVRPILEYGSVIWSPYYAVHINRIEAVQFSFVRHIKNIWELKGITLTTEETRRKLNIMTLQQRRIMIDLCLFYNIVNNRIDSPEILNEIKLLVPAKILRDNRLLEASKDRSNFIKNGPRNRIFNTVNDYTNQLNYFGGSYSIFKKDVINILSDF